MDAFIGAVAADLKDGNKVTIPGFGTFEVKKRAARTGINPATKEQIKLLHAAFQHLNLEKALKTNFNFGII